MTTQTTRERIQHVMREAFDPYGSGDIDDACDHVAAEIDAQAARIKELEAEIERLRLPAEAWEAREAWINSPEDNTIPSREDKRWVAYQDADNRARARQVTP